MDLTTRKQNLDRDITHINDCIIAQSPISISFISDACEEYFAIREEERKVFEQTEKYKWHSLKDNPNDLPTEHMVLACIRGIGGHKYHDVIYYGKPLGVHPKPKGKVFYQCDSEWGDYVIDDVVWWKYIEPLEVDE